MQTENPASSQFVGVADAAKMLNVTRATLYLAIKQGRIEAIRTKVADSDRGRGKPESVLLLRESDVLNYEPLAHLDKRPPSRRVNQENKSGEVIETVRKRRGRPTGWRKYPERVSMQEEPKEPKRRGRPLGSPNRPKA